MSREKPNEETSFPQKKKKQQSEDRARFIIDQCPHKITGEVNLPWGQLLSPEHESGLEKDAIYVLAMCWDVLSIISQPERLIFITQDGKKGKYRVDLKLYLRTDGIKRVEIKPLSVCFKETVMERLMAIATHYASQNEAYDILTDDVIRAQPRLDLCKRLRGFLKQAVSEELLSRVRDALGTGPLKISDLLVTLGGHQYWADVLTLIAHRHLCISWQEPYSKDMQVSLPHLPFPPLTYVALTNSSRFRPLVQELAMGCRPTDQRLLAAARAKDWSISLPDPFGVVGTLPRRAMQVGRTDGCQAAGGDGDGTFSEVGLPGHFGSRKKC